MEWDSYVSTSDYNIKRQPKLAIIMATKTGNSCTTGTTTDSVENSNGKSMIFDHSEPE